MNIHTDLGLGEVLTRLAVARGGLLDDVTSEVYLDKLDRFSLSLVARACDHWAVIPREKFETTLPSVGQLIDTIEQFAREDQAAEQARRVLPLPKTDDEGPRYFCLDCRDEPAGWLILWCPGSGASRTFERPDYVEGSIVECARRPHGGHLPHPYTDRCRCFETNPVIQRAREREAARLAERSSRPRRGAA